MNERIRQMAEQAGFFVHHTLVFDSDTATLEAFARLVASDIDAEINAMIKTGDIGGNGCDPTAQRNGLILASNAIRTRYKAP